MDNNNNQGTQGPYTYYQNLYNMFGGVNPIIDKNVNELRRLGMLCGTGILGFSIMQFIVSIVLTSTGLYDEYKTDMILQHGVGIIAPVFYVFLPFFIIYLFYKPEEKKQVIAFDKPKSWQTFLLAIVAGLMICTFGDIFTSVFSGTIAATGVDFTSPDVDIPTDFLGKLLMVIECAVIPALVEEFALRGVVMSPLRKFGDWFAIIVTSVIFALMHGNMVQIPFAFIAGIALGYFRITTGSLWTSIVIHSLNNLASVLISLYYNSNENAGYFVIFIFNSAIIILGIFALVLFVKENGFKLRKDPTNTDRRLKTASYLCTPTIVLSITIAVYSTLLYTNITSVSGTFILLLMLAIIGFFIIRGLGTLKNEKRINRHPSYSVSMVIIVISLIVEIYIVMAVTFADRIVSR